MSETSAVRVLALASLLTAFALLAPGISPPPAPQAASAATLPSGFSETIAISGLSYPTAVRFSPDGRVFVAEKSGAIKVFDSLQDTTPTIFTDLSSKVHDYWDRGLLGMALDPGFPNIPYVYVLYTYDHELGSSASPPRWGDVCPDPPGPTSDGCVVSGRLSRLQAAGNVMTGSEQVLVEDWCQQYPSHSVGAVEFGPDGMVYASAGDGASFTFNDYGQDGSPLNPCGDPPGGIGATLTPPTAEGGSLRSQDLRTPADPVTLDGSIIRVDPATGEAPPTNPMAGSSDANARRIIAHGLRNPFRFAFRPGSNEIWIGDVGGGTWEEINRVLDPTDGIVENFGWPCYEGAPRQSGFDAADLSICEDLYGSPNADTKPYFAYQHSNKVVSGETCGTGSSSVAGISFEFAPLGSTFPSEYQGALFFADYSRDCIWAMTKQGNPIPSPGSIKTFVAGAANPVNLEFGPYGDLFYVDFDGGTIRRVSNQTPPPPPTGRTLGDPTDYAAGTNPHGSAIADLNGDGKADLVIANASSNNVSVLLGDGTGAFGTATQFATGSFPKSVHLADVSGDGKLDAVTANQGSNSVSVLIGNGNGGFATPRSYPVCTGTHEVAIGNFNGDARPDLAAACFAGSVISVLLGTGAGDFGATTTYAAGAGPHSIIARDFDNDGAQDLAIANHDEASVSVLGGVGNGTFQTPVNYSVGACPHSIRSGDFTGDGIVDLVTANECADNVSLLVGTAAGTFAAAANFPTGRVPKSVAVADFNGDGKRDVITANTAGNYPSGASNPGGDQVSVLLGNGTGGFGAPTSYLAGNTPFSVSVGQLNDDGQPDVVTANWFGNDASVLLNTTLQPLSGMNYLSELTWTSMTNGWGPVEKDMSNGEDRANDGRAITLNGTTFYKGLGAHAASDVRYSLNGCTRFLASVGVDDEVGSNGSVTFEVYADATKVYDSGLMTGATATRTVDVSVAGASELRLVVTDGGNGIDYDHADWALARIECPGNGDTTAPTVMTTTPADSTTGIPVTVSPTVTFSEAMNASTLNTTTLTLVRQGTATPVEASVTYDSAQRIATLDPSGNLLPTTVYTATIKGGSSGAKDLAGNALEADVGWTFTTSSESNPVTVHHLSDLDWTSATNSFGPVQRDKSADGNPITLDGTTYAKGLGAHAASDVRYSVEGCDRFKTSIGIDDEVGSNGSVTFEVYADSTRIYDSGLMTGTSATEMIDVSIAGATELRLAVTNAGDNFNFDHADWAQARIECGSGSDTNPPTITATAPANGMTEVAAEVSPTATFSEAMDASTITTATFTLMQEGASTPVAATVSYDGATRTATLDPSSDLVGGAVYTATVVGGASGAKDLAGNAVEADVTWDFTTTGAANEPPSPIIDSPPSTLLWKVGDLISFTGHATDPDEGTLPDSALSWSLVMQHCPSNCHAHTIQTWTGVASGSFSAPDHEYPSYLELTLTANDSAGASASTTLRLDPMTVNLTFDSTTTGLQLVVNGVPETAPFTRTVIVGSTNSLSAPSPQVLNGTTLEFSSWSDGGAQTHDVTAPLAATTYTAMYASLPVNTALPSIIGNARVGETLTASTGTWAGSLPIAFAYQWLICTKGNIASCSTITSATSHTYVVKTTDVGARVRIRVTATNTYGSDTATSDSTSRIRN